MGIHLTTLLQVLMMVINLFAICLAAWGGAEAYRVYRLVKRMPVRVRRDFD